jgi:hypothetical protein
VGTKNLLVMDCVLTKKPMAEKKAKDPPRPMFAGISEGKGGCRALRAEVPKAVLGIDWCDDLAS